MLEKITVNKLSKKYGDKHALNDVTVDFNKGKVYAILGHNGAGKTTLIKEILKFSPRSNESIKYFSNLKKEIADPKFAMSFSPEHYILLEDLTVYEYIVFTAKLYKKYSNELIEKIDNLLLFFEIYKQKNKFIFSLSNGMKKKLCHISAFILETDFTFLDEPFATLDPVSTFNLKTYLLENMNRTCFIICTHQLDIIDNLNLDNKKLELVLLNKGQIVFQGTKQELFNQAGEKSIEKAYIKYHR